MERKKYLDFLMLAGLLAVISVLHIYVRPAYDDFFYATFLDNGIKDFFDMNVSHYINNNGRSFVHLLLCPLLSFNLLPFKIFNILLFFCTAFVISKFYSENKNENIHNLVISLSVLCLTGGRVLSNGALWGAGSLNYLFPAFLTLFYSYLYKKSLEEEKRNKLTYILAFLTGATVEMNGFFPIIAIIYFSIIYSTEAKRNKTFIFLNLVFALIGYATLFLSPGVADRFSGNSYDTISLFERIIANLSIFSRKFLSISGVGLHITLIMVDIFIWSFKKKCMPFTVCSFTTSVLIMLIMTGILVNWIWVSVVSVISIVILLCFSIYLFKNGEKIVLFFSLITCISLGVCILSPVVGDRMLLPTSIFMTAILVRIIKEIPRNIRLIISVLVFLGGVIFVGVLIPHFSSASKIADVNLNETARFEDNGELILNQVSDEYYCSGTVPDHFNFADSYLKHFKLNNTQIRIKDKFHIVVANGRGKYEGVLRDDVPYVPVSVASEFGCSVSWRLAAAEVLQNGITYRFVNGANSADYGLNTVKLAYPVRIINSKTYISVFDFNRLFKTDFKPVF